MDPNVEPRRLVLRLSNVSGLFQLRKQNNNADIHSLTSFPVRFREQSDPFHRLRFDYVIARVLRYFMQSDVIGPGNVARPLERIVRRARVIQSPGIIPLGLNAQPIKHRYRVSVCVEVLERAMIDEEVFARLGEVRLLMKDSIWLINVQAPQGATADDVIRSQAIMAVDSHPG